MIWGPLGGGDAELIVGAVKGQGWWVFQAEAARRGCEDLLQKQKYSRSSGKSQSVGCQRTSVGGQTQIIEPEDQSAQPGLCKKKESVNLKTCQ